ncbi:MAG: hypothetical protein JW942_06155 [Opitutales bacterium]|nr:hypothetical protein [Opitutales bacterium]
MRYKSRSNANVSVSISLPEHMQEQLRLAAEDDNRSVSNLVSSIIGAYLIREGYLNANANGEYVHSAPPRQTRLRLVAW